VVEKRRKNKHCHSTTHISFALIFWKKSIRVVHTDGAKIHHKLMRPPLFAHALCCSSCCSFPPMNKVLCNNERQVVAKRILKKKSYKVVIRVALLGSLETFCLQMVVSTMVSKKQQGQQQLNFEKR
jgi:hypothetical protein